MPAPSTGLLDNFNRANGPLGANWTIPAFLGDGTPTIIGNQFDTSSGAGWKSAYWSATSFGADQEVWGVVPSVNTAIELLARLSDGPGTATMDGYLLDISVGGTWTIWKIINNNQTQVGVSATQVLGAADLVWFELIGTAITAYRKVGAGAWTSILSVTDASVTVGGFIGAAAPGSTLDDFSGGTVVPAGGVLRKPVVISQTVQSAARRCQAVKEKAMGDLWLPTPVAA